MEHLKDALLWQVLAFLVNLSCLHYTGLERPASDEHFSLIDAFMNYLGHDTHLKDIQHNDTQHNNKYCDTHHSMLMLSVVLLSVIYAEGHN